MSSHPYPDHIVKAIAAEIQPLFLTTEEAQFVVIQVLESLWERTLVPDRQAMYHVPEDAYVMNTLGHTYPPNTYLNAPDEYDYPAHIVKWGEA